MGAGEFARTRSLLDRLTAEGMWPGAAVLVQRGGESLLQYAAGLARLQPPLPARTDHIWGVASVSKPVATVALMQMVERGLVRLDQPVVELLPDFGPGKERVLVGQLVNHTNGLSEEFPAIETVMRLGSVAAIGGMPLSFEPGTAVQYSTPAFEIMKAVVCKLSGKDWVEYTNERIFAPLTMRDTTYNPPASWNERIPIAYDTENSSTNWVNDPQTRAFAIAGGGLYSTLADLAAFGQAFLEGGRGILSPESHDAMTGLRTAGLREFASGRVETWGLGWYLNMDSRPGGVSDILSPRTYMHGGATGTWLAVDPERELVIVLLANRLDLDHSVTRKNQARLARAVLKDIS